KTRSHIMFPAVPNSAAMLARREKMPVINANKKGNTLKHPSPKGPRIFCDSAVKADIAPLLKAGLIHGITTNPTLLKKAGAKSWKEAKAIMKDLCAMLNPFPVSLELTELTEEKMVKQAAELGALGKNAVIKVPMGGYPAVVDGGDPFTGLKVIR